MTETTWAILVSDAKVVWRDLKRMLYRVNDLRLGIWCDGCQMSGLWIPHTCSGKHLYSIIQDGDNVVEFGLTYRRKRDKEES